MKPKKQGKITYLADRSQKLLSSYREFWDEKLAACVTSLTDEQYREIFQSLYSLLRLPAPLVVSVDSPMQLMLMPALLRIRALSDQSTWQMIRNNLNGPFFKETMDALEKKISNQDVEKLAAQRNSAGSPLTNNEWETRLCRDVASLDSIFCRPKGNTMNTRPTIFHSLITELEMRMLALVSDQVREWVGSQCTWMDGGFPGQTVDLINQDLRSESTRLNQLRIAVQNLSNMGTTERAALRIFRERGDATAMVPAEIVKQGELESQFLLELGEKTVNILALALSARNLEPTIYESYPPVLEAMLDGNSSGLWFTGQLAVGFNSMIMHPSLERLPQFTFLLDAGQTKAFDKETALAIENLRIFMANRTPISPFTEIVFVSKPPLRIETDEEGRLHSTEKPALRYADGYALYSIHGVTVSEKTAVAPDSLSVQDIESEINLEVRRIMLERFGIGRFLTESNAEVIHEDEYGTLYRRSMAGDEPLVMVRVKNSTPEPDGSFREYFLRVPPFMRSAKEAVAWTFDIDEDNYQLDEES